MPFLSQLFLYTNSSVMVVSSRLAESNGMEDSQVRFVGISIR